MSTRGGKHTHRVNWLLSHTLITLAPELSPLQSGSSVFIQDLKIDTLAVFYIRQVVVIFAAYQLGIFLFHSLTFGVVLSKLHDK